MISNELCFTPAAELGRLIRAWELSPVELVDAILDRIEEINPRINAFLTVTADLAREQARASERRALRGELLGPLDGIPYSLKDLEATAGIRTTFGSKFFENNVPTEDGSVAARLRATGAILLGKTNTPQFGHTDMCDNLLGPPCRNPWQLDRTAGGSSGGAAAAVSAGLAPLAQGSDGGGSIRIPASLCGVFGFKPSFGRVPCYPNSDYWAARGSKGTLTRTVRDSALLLEAMAGPDHRDPLSIDTPAEDYLVACDGDLKGLKVAWSADLGYATVDPEVDAITQAAAHHFKDLGCELVDCDPAWSAPGAYHRVIVSVAMAARYAELAAERPEWVEPSMMYMIASGSCISAIEHGKALLGRAVFYDEARRFFDNYDLLLTPQMPLTAWSVMPQPSSWPKEIGRQAISPHDRTPFCHPFNLTGQPAATVPCGFTSEGLPVGLQIVGRWHADSTVLRAAACFEAAQPWAQHRPPIR